MVKVKICGITNLEDALFCSKCGADALGFIFSKKSPRCLGEKQAKEIIDNLDPFISKVGVFVDEKKERVFEIASFLNLDVLQFHGKESPSYCAYFKKKIKMIKTLFPQDRPFKEKILKYKRVDSFLFDIKYEEKIKGEKSLSEEILKEIKFLIKKGVRVIISGGLNINNILKIKKASPYAVDVCSGLEKFVGRKDKDLVVKFIQKVKK
ncbi:MAG TPA: phosphoribosylanthranilate isomerase [Candidatus Omnitrophica bacterium]|nr:phosphoribosylanthranilate isomerase [Candidatus Omnitrophota bacterium]